MTASCWARFRPWAMGEAGEGEDMRAQKMERKGGRDAAPKNIGAAAVVIIARRGKAA